MKKKDVRKGGGSKSRPLNHKLRPRNTTKPSGKSRKAGYMTREGNAAKGDKGCKMVVSYS